VRVAVGFGVAVLTVGCGDVDGVTRADWARDANAICAKYDHRFDALGTAEELPALACLLAEAISLLDKERSELSRLDTPRGDEDRIRQLLAYLEGTTAAAGQAREAAQRGDEQAVGVAIGESDSAASQARHVARDLGATTCAEP
jgi:hypothetical protein